MERGKGKGKGEGKRKEKCRGERGIERERGEEEGK